MINHPVLSFYGTIHAYLANGSHSAAITEQLFSCAKRVSGVSKQILDQVMGFYNLTEPEQTESFLLHVCKCMFRDLGADIEESAVGGIFKKMLALAKISDHVFIMIADDNHLRFISNNPDKLIGLMTELRFCKPYKTHIIQQGSTSYL